LEKAEPAAYAKGFDWWLLELDLDERFEFVSGGWILKGEPEPEPEDGLASFVEEKPLLTNPFLPSAR